MYILKSIYFYFLAAQINLLKYLKKIYFTTDYYNRSLTSKTPSQFIFTLILFFFLPLQIIKATLLELEKLIQIYFG